MIEINSMAQANAQQPEVKAPAIPTEDERKKVKDQLKILIHQTELNILPFCELWINRNYTSAEQMATIESKKKTYELLIMMYKSYEYKSCNSTC